MLNIDVKKIVLSQLGSALHRNRKHLDSDVVNLLFKLYHLERVSKFIELEINKSSGYEIGKGGATETRIEDLLQQDEFRQWLPGQGDVPKDLLLARFAAIGKHRTELEKIAADYANMLTAFAGEADLITKKHILELNQKLSLDCPFRMYPFCGPEDPDQPNEAKLPYAGAE